MVHLKLSGLRRTPIAVACACGILSSGLVSCQADEWIEEAPSPGNVEASEYWYTRTRSGEQQSTMLRSHAVGFSYDAIYGESCDPNSVRCQVLNLEELEDRQVYYATGHTETRDHYYTAHSLSEYLSVMSNEDTTSTKFMTYKKEAKNVASIFENRTDDIVLISQTRVCQAIEKGISMEDYRDELAKEKDPYHFLSPAFRYGIEKLKNNENVAVVDSFINIFGTHVVTEASVGGRIKLNLVVSTSTIKTLNSERRISSECLDLYLKNYSSSSSSETQVFYEGILKNADLSLSVKGGDVAAFNELVANPHGNARTPTLLKNWMASLSKASSSSWDSRLELSDMQILPIWEFIPDKRIADRVHARIEASAPTMQELYGNRNFIDVQFPSYVSSVTCQLGGMRKSFNDPYVVDVFAANRHVATLCKEWVPEIDKDHAVVVAYPIYENKVQLNAGVCSYEGVAYNVRWLYDRFSVDTLSVLHQPGDMLYLQAGFIQAKPHEQVRTYQEAKLAVGYEWPGSIGINGELQAKPYYETRKFLDNFFLNTEKTFTDLPNWSICKEGVYNGNYSKYLETSRPYELSGLPNVKDWNSLKGRMIRNKNYIYFYNPTELRW